MSFVSRLALSCSIAAIACSSPVKDGGGQGRMVATESTGGASVTSAAGSRSSGGTGAFGGSDSSSHSKNLAGGSADPSGSGPVGGRGGTSSGGNDTGSGGDPSGGAGGASNELGEPGGAGNLVGGAGGASNELGELGGAGNPVGGAGPSSAGAAAVSGGLEGGFVEDQGAHCTASALPGLGSLPSVEKLPDPFKKLDGSVMSSKSEWVCRRQEIKRLAENFVYGEKPPKPEMVTGTVTESSITVNVSHQGKSASFSVSVDLPATGSAPYPSLMSYGAGFFGFSQNRLLKGEGVAIIEYDPYVVGSERASRQSKAGAFYDIYGADSKTGLLVAWAWGVSRIIDVLESAGSTLFKAERTAVAGCSRFGKGALIAGVFDQRVALTIPFESGTAGVPIWRGVPGEGAQSLSSAYGETYWFGDAFAPFTNSPATLPIDTHEVLAMVAPRGLLVLDNPSIANLGPQSAHVAALGAAEVYSALGVGENISYHSAVADGSHCSPRPEHVTPLKENVQKFLFGIGDAPGALKAAGKATGDLARWRDWTTPELK